MNLRLPRLLVITIVIVIAFLVGHAARLLAQPASLSAPTTISSRPARSTSAKLA